MRHSGTWFKTSDGAELFVRMWQPAEGVAPVAVLHIHHGMAEHGGRYERFALEAVQEGFVVIAHDVRAHGKTAEKAAPPGLGCLNIGTSDPLRLATDLKELIKDSRKAFPGVPLLVLGHSLGSVISQLATGKGDGVSVEGLILSGPPARMKAIELKALGGVVSLLSAMQGADAFSSITEKLTTEKFQSNLLKRAGIKGTTGCEWLSRDVDECKKYAEDPHCGHPMSNGFFKALVPMFTALNTPAAVAPASVPVMVITGESDACGIHDFGTYAFAQINALYSAQPGRSAPKVVLYGGARHELLNETNREEVTRDALGFLKACARGPQSKL